MAYDTNVWLQTPGWQWGEGALGVLRDDEEK